MPRRQFLQDLDRVKIHPPDRIRNVHLEDDEIVAFCFVSQTGDGIHEIKLQLIPTNIDGYPAASSYILFTDDNDVDVRTLNTLEAVQGSIEKVKISQAFEIISSNLIKGGQTLPRPQSLGFITDEPTVSKLLPSSIPGASAVHVTPLDEKDAGNHNEQDQASMNEYENESDHGFGFADSEEEELPVLHNLRSQEPLVDLARIRADLLATKRAGFRIGVYEQLTTGGIVSVSIRVAKLGISEEAMKAWDLDKTQYLVLLVRFRHGYRTLSMVQSNKGPMENVQMHVGLCNTYKPSCSAAIEVFEHTKWTGRPDIPQSTQRTTPGAFLPLFIGKPLNDLLRNRFAKIVHLRGSGLSWAGAEKLFNETQCSTNKVAGTVLKNHLYFDGAPLQHALPAIVMADALKSERASDASLPLVAMQFVLRHFVRCTEFCLVCHCAVDSTFGALRPYVCSKPLCLYQFFSYGFGPSVEYEIISQPYVVDLLISLCFSQACASKLTDMPYGLRLKVPLLPPEPVRYTKPVYTPQVPKSYREPKRDTLKDKFASFSAKLAPLQERLTVNSDTWKDVPHLRGGEWVTVARRGDEYRHYRIRQVLPPYIFLSDCISVETDATKSTDVASNSDIWVQCYMHDREFDTIPKHLQHQAIMTIIRCLPSVLELRKRLKAIHPDHSETSLHALREIPPAARDLLRWIIASNRSYIVQVVPVCAEDRVEISRHATESRVSGMPDWIQFRFAQGAPDKEQRFVEAVRRHATNKESPTLFAWHGSALYNWHSIIRQGLNFKEMTHGRANGNGVYMSSQLQTSLAYTTLHKVPSLAFATWPNSELKPLQVVSLQEFVNAPASFVCRNPHFVVAQEEWIQTRYLLVRTAHQAPDETTSQTVYRQDSRHRVVGENNIPVKIPLVAASSLIHGSQSTIDSRLLRKRKVPSESSENQDSDNDDIVSVATLAEDLRWFDINDDPTSEDCDVAKGDGSSVITSPSGRKRRKASKPYILDPAQTDFIPGTLDLSDIKFLSAPSDATTVATTTLMKSFNEFLHTQENTPLHELGFYIDPDCVENMYQWIIELHSFDKSLPLAQDLQSAGLTSVVLEMRFSNQFPYVPPFVRVVKPRFLPFLSGGGGHVTEGGAICMELLTSTGWSAVLSIESVLLQIRLALCETERPARLLKLQGVTASGNARYDTSSYSIGEAVAAFRRACSKHGWQIPAELETMGSRA